MLEGFCLGARLVFGGGMSLLSDEKEMRDG